MTDKIKQSAIKIWGLLNKAPATYCTELHAVSNQHLSKRYTSYDGLMPIVLECNYMQDDLDIEIVMYGSGIDVHLDDEDVLITTFDSEPEFIHAIQLAVIKYLELKNES